LRAAHLLETSDRTRNAVRLRAKRAYKPRTLRVRNSFHNHWPTGFAKLVKHRLQWNHYRLHRTYGLGVGLDRRALGGGALRGSGRSFSGRSQRGALGISAQRSPAGIASCSRSCSCSGCSHCFCSHQAALLWPPGLVLLFSRW